MSYNKMTYSELTPVALLVLLSDMIDTREYMKDEMFDEGENFDTESQKIITEITNQIRVK